MKIVAGKEQEYADWKAKNDDGYSAACFAFAEKWADQMENMLAATDATVSDVAEQAEDIAVQGSGLTGFQYGMAVAILANVWVHGDALRRWHNLKWQLGDEGERANERGTVLNPALLNIGTKEADYDPQP